MGISYRALAMYGIYFDSQDDAIEFIQQNGYPDFEDTDEIENEFEMELVSLDCYSGVGVILGVHVRVGETLDAAKDLWNKYFPKRSIEPKAHLEVRVH